MLMDTTDAHADVASMKLVNDILHSSYKHHSNMKSLVMCDPIRIVWDECISSGCTGSVSNVVGNTVTKTLDQIPFG